MVSSTEQKSSQLKKNNNTYSKNHHNSRTHLSQLSPLPYVEFSNINPCEKKFKNSSAMLEIGME